MPIDIQTIPCGDIEICLGIAGSGPPLLFLGGTGWDLRAIPNPLLSPLTDHFTVALFDQRGQGRTSKPCGPYSMTGYAQDALAVANWLGWDAPFLVGYSFGGMVAQEYAIRFPKRLRKLVLAATTSGGQGGSSYPVHELLDLQAEDRARQGLRASDRRFAPLEAACPHKAEAMVQKRMRSQTRFMHEENALQGLRSQLEARKHHNSFDRLGSIARPTLVLAGKDDLQAPIDAQQRMADSIPNARLEQVEGAHNFIFESDLAYQRITSFFNPEATVN
jgi:3-oxoadipate enol-lactonase